ARGVQVRRVQARTRVPTHPHRQHRRPPLHQPPPVRPSLRDRRHIPVPVQRPPPRPRPPLGQGQSAPDPHVPATLQLVCRRRVRRVRLPGLHQPRPPLAHSRRPPLP